MSKSLSPRQIGALIRILGLPETEIRKHIPDHEAASPIIGAAKRGDMSGVAAALPAPLREAVDPAFLADRVAREAKKAPAPAATEPETPEVPAQAQAQAPGDAPADAAAWVESAKADVAAIVGSLGFLAQEFRADLSGKLSGIVESGAAVLAEAVRKAAEAAKPEMPVPPPAKPDYFRPSWFGEAFAAAKAGVDLLLTGPAGTGKSRAGRELAAALERPAHVFACKAGMRRADLFYSKELEGGETVCRLAPFLAAVQEPGVVVLDEVFALDPEVLLGLNGLLESGQRSIDTPTGTVERHPENVLVLTANTAGRQESRIYRGAQAQDASTLSRVLVFRTNYEPTVETGMARAAGLSAKDADWLVSQVKALREALGRAQVAHDVTPRSITQAARLIGAGLSRERAARLALLGPLEPSEIAKVGGALDSAILAA